MLADQPPRPANMQRIVVINQGRAPYTSRLAEPQALVPGDVAAAARDGELILDTRPAATFGAAHVPRALNLPVAGSGFEQNVGWLAPGERPFVLVVERPDDARLALQKLAFVGLDQRVRGWLDFAAWSGAGLPAASLDSIDVATLQRRVAAGQFAVVDVREPGEWRAGHIDGAVLVSYRHLPAQLAELPLDRDRPVAVICEGGVRSSTGASILAHHGFRMVYDVAGGMDAWRRAGLATTIKNPADQRSKDGGRQGP